MPRFISCRSFGPDAPSPYGVYDQQERDFIVYYPTLLGAYREACRRNHQDRRETEPGSYRHKTETFYIYSLDDGGYTPVQGYKATLKAFPDLTLFLHKEKDRWICSEATTGLALVYCAKTRPEALYEAHRVLSRLTPEKLLATFGRALIENGPSPYVP